MSHNPRHSQLPSVSRDMTHEKGGCGLGARTTPEHESESSEASVFQPVPFPFPHSSWANEIPTAASKKQM